MMAADEVRLFKNYKLPILTLINFVYFYESFNSITLKEPLIMSFNVIYERFLDSGKTDMSMGYNLLELAFTLDSRRIRDQKALQRVIDTNEIIRDPVLNILASISIDILGKDRYKDFRLEVKKASKTLSMVQKELIAKGFTSAQLAFYRPKVERVAGFFIQTEKELAPQIKYSFTECEGSIQFPMSDGSFFTLTGKADRIDILNNGSYVITDYKTGRVPTPKEVFAGYAPQLPLEAYILSQGGLPDLQHKPLYDLVYFLYV